MREGDVAQRCARGAGAPQRERPAPRRPVSLEESGGDVEGGVDGDVQGATCRAGAAAESGSSFGSTHSDTRFPGQGFPCLLCTCSARICLPSCLAPVPPAVLDSKVQPTTLAVEFPGTSTAPAFPVASLRRKSLDATTSDTLPYVAMAPASKALLEDRAQRVKRAEVGPEPGSEAMNAAPASTA